MAHSTISTIIDSHSARGNCGWDAALFDSRRCLLIFFVIALFVSVFVFVFVFVSIFVGVVATDFFLKCARGSR
jgi:hypothetical protein